jgi:hypothetical protein
VINSISTQKTEKHRSSVLYSSFFVGLIAEINRTCPSSEQQLQEGSASAKIVSRWFFVVVHSLCKAGNETQHFWMDL